MLISLHLLWANVHNLKNKTNAAACVCNWRHKKKSGEALGTQLSNPTQFVSEDWWVQVQSLSGAAIQQALLICLQPDLH